MSPYDQQAGPGIGATLKDARRRLGMDIKEAEDRTKIRTRYLRALEAEEWEILPGPAYVRGFLRTYGQILGLDGEALADRYRRNSRSLPSPPPRLQNRSSATAARRRIAAAVAERLDRRDRRCRRRPPRDPGGDRAHLAATTAASRARIKPTGKAKKKDEKQVAQAGQEEAGADRRQHRAADDGTGLPRRRRQSALIDSQVLAVGATENTAARSPTGSISLGGGTVRMKAGGEEKKLEASGDASFEADQDGIREIDFAGPDCP